MRVQFFAIFPAIRKNRLPQIKFTTNIFPKNFTPEQVFSKVNSLLLRIASVLPNAIFSFRFKISSSCSSEQSSPTYDALMLREFRFETWSFMREINGTITNTMALQASPNKWSKVYGASSKVRLLPAPVGADTKTSFPDRYASIVFLW